MDSGRYSRRQVWMCTTAIWIVDRKCHWNNEGVASFKGQDRILREVIESSHMSFIWTSSCHCLRVGRLPNTTQMSTRKCTVIQIHVSFFFFFDHAANRRENDLSLTSLTLERFFSMSNITKCNWMECRKSDLVVPTKKFSWGNSKRILNK